MTIDVSEGGLLVRTDLGVEQGDALRVRLSLPGEGPIDLEATVWHVRRARRRTDGKRVQLLGLMLTRAPDAYLRFVPRAAPAKRGEELEDDGATRPPLSSFRVRAKESSSPRTRVLCFAADSLEEASELAEEQLGAGWEILEIREA